MKDSENPRKNLRHEAPVREHVSKKDGPPSAPDIDLPADNHELSSTERVERAKGATQPKSATPGPKH
jgi:hypothetical protein